MGDTITVTLNRTEARKLATWLNFTEQHLAVARAIKLEIESGSPQQPVVPSASATLEFVRCSVDAILNACLEDRVRRVVREMLADK